MLSLKNIFNRTSYTPISNSVLKEYNKHRDADSKKYPCYSPFKSIYFGHHGRAITCCYNRNYLLGEFPKQSIKEIWFGEDADRLRDYIAHNDFSLGCGSCKQQLEAGNFDGTKAKDSDKMKLNANRYPSIMQFELSNLCNLECEMCSGDFSSLIRAKREKLPPIVSPYGDDFVNQLEEFIPHLEEVKFYGGEPFLIETYYQIWEKIKEINPSVRIIVQTNATVLNNRVKELLSQTNFHLNISFDSLNKETYESIRKNADFEKVSENIKYFHIYCKSKNTFFGISACAMQSNWKELPQFINFCNEMEALVYFHTVFYPLHSSIRAMSQDEIAGVIEYLSGFDFPENNSVQKKNRTHYFDFVNQVKAWYGVTAPAPVANGKKIENFVQLKEEIAAFIKADVRLSENKREAKVQRINKKLTEFENNLDPALVRQMFSTINVADPGLIDNVVSYADKLPVRLLVMMAKSNAKK
ncbi:MAG: Radical domain protein [Bacteroidota bacterium]|nr:Radical domain protein [Bacteroidota bacterium]